MENAIMSEKEIREIDHFDAISSDGRVFTITIHQEYIISRLLDGSISKIPGFKKITTSEGYDVNYKDDTTFQIVDLNLLVKKVGS
jgi:hypothetical protein